MFPIICLNSLDYSIAFETFFHIIPSQKYIFSIFYEVVKKIDHISKKQSKTRQNENRTKTKNENIQRPEKIRLMRFNCWVNKIYIQYFMSMRMRIMEKISIRKLKQDAQNCNKYQSTRNMPPFTKLIQGHKQKNSQKSNSFSKSKHGSSTDTSLNSIKRLKQPKKNNSTNKGELKQIAQTYLDSNSQLNYQNNDTQFKLISQVLGFSFLNNIQDPPSRNFPSQLQTARSNQKKSCRTARQVSIDESPKTKQCQTFSQDCNLKQKFLQLFDLYVKQEIIKHYCEKTGWKFTTQHEIDQKNNKIKNKSKLIQNIVLPTLDLLAIRKQNMKEMFEPFLTTITQKYLLQTQIDIYSRYTSQFLLIEITQIWIKIKQAQIALKRQIRRNLTSFKRKYCVSQQIYYDSDRIKTEISSPIQANSQIRIDRQKLYKFLFQNSKQIKMVNVIKLFMFMHKVCGEKFEKSWLEWLQKY